MRTAILTRQYSGKPVSYTHLIDKCESSVTNMTKNIETIDKACLLYTSAEFQTIFGTNVDPFLYPNLQSSLNGKSRAHYLQIHLLLLCSKQSNALLYIWVQAVLLL